MERLTRRINGVVVYVGAKNPYSTGQIPCEVEPAGVREMMDRLAAYEDTWLEPEEVLPKDKADEIALKLMRLADLESLCSYTRLRELAEADAGASSARCSIRAPHRSRSWRSLPRKRRSSLMRRTSRRRF